MAQAPINKAMRMRCMAGFLRAARSFAHVLIGEPGTTSPGHAPTARGRRGTSGTAASLGQADGESATASAAVMTAWNVRIRPGGAHSRLVARMEARSAVIRDDRPALRFA